ncbi:MAG: hypothetical protein HGB03_01155 [Candidatus Yonathbacteria bacterium]|nr:hypothetical protein [Candidatus Yonathbacteria bacterium]NTW47872.1 hypothetical protein [Candidatus Yonathbacteria bacterium]
MKQNEAEEILNETLRLANVENRSRYCQIGPLAIFVAPGDKPLRLLKHWEDASFRMYIPEPGESLEDIAKTIVYRAQRINECVAHLPSGNTLVAKYGDTVEGFLKKNTTFDFSQD